MKRQNYRTMKLRFKLNLHANQRMLPSVHVSLLFLPCFALEGLSSDLSRIVLGSINIHIKVPLAKFFGLCCTGLTGEKRKERKEMKKRHKTERRNVFNEVVLRRRERGVWKKRNRASRSPTVVRTSKWIR